MKGSKLYVGNFSYSTVDSQPEELFSAYGKVESAIVIGEKGFGFVEMSNTSEAEKAQDALEVSEFGGRTLKVNEAHPKKPKNDRRY